MWLIYPLSHSSTGSIPLTNLLRSRLNSLITNTTSIFRFITLAFSFPALSLKILSISKFSIKGVLYPNLIYQLLFLILFIKFTASKHYTLLTILISLNGEIISSYFCYAKKGLVYIALTSPFRRQPSFCLKCTKANT
jgi:hypothetical protein